MKLILLTGFLGAGKTTLLKKILNEYQSRKIGILMNEFGEIGIDGQLIKNENFDLIELNNGSVFCACLKENFIGGLAQFLNHELEIVFVESSGVADPANMGSILKTVTKIAGKAYDYLGSICIVDGRYFLKQLDVIAALERQIIYASKVIINKADLQNPETLQVIAQKITTINPTTEIFKASFCEVPLADLIMTMKSDNVKTGTSGNTWESRPQACVLRTEALLDYKIFEKFLHEIKFSTHRIKGFVRTDQGGFEVSSVRDLAILTQWNEPIEQTEIVMISAVGIRMISDLLRLWKQSFGDTPMHI
ncbi:GTP-binding protein [Acetobacterium wieringae]|uniref:CobW family GTP-binding protein n=1 Tax=Acetobacterium wieringae TaxID=52694 RepID=UPI0026EC28E9|nr:CobW family GTP-binding protein [Acetobacterium wieringae]